jgi:hypothetical protein
MPLLEIDPLYGDREKGLDFGGFFHVEDVVQSALDQFWFHTDAAVCYCLQFHCIDRAEDGDSYFEPYGAEFGRNGLITAQEYSLPSVIHYLRLVRKIAGDFDRWPLLGHWTAGNGLASRHPPQLARAVFHGAVRLQVGDLFVGYFKAVWLEGDPIAHEEQLQRAYDRTQQWLCQEISKRQQERSLLERSARDAFEQLHAFVEHRVLARNLAGAAQVLCTLLTSHLGADVNRVACLAPVEEGLRCIYAHGGDCSERFSWETQKGIVERTPSLEKLKEQLGTYTPPQDDSLYNELCQGPVALGIDDPNASASLVAALWRAAGDMTGWTDSIDAVVALPGTHVNRQRGGVTIGDKPHVVGLRLTARDPLLASWGSNRTGSAWLANRNQQWFALPMIWRGQILAIFLIDQGYRHTPDLARDLLPRLLRAEELINEFAPQFA